MSTGPLIHDRSVAAHSGTSSRWYILAATFLAVLFLAFSLIRSPIPGVNESHYLSKAKHFWQPQWCRGDLFLESANPHAVFYGIFGLLTTKFSLTTSALIIRAGQSLLLATGWLALTRRCLGNWHNGLTAAALFLLLQSTGTWSGEWIVGGAESKVWSYGFLFFAAAWGLDQRWLLSALLVGLAISMHPVVGCWGLVIALIAWVGNWLVAGLTPRVLPQTNSSIDTNEMVSPETSHGVTLLRIALVMTVVFCTSLPGLIPAIQSLSAPNARIASEADFLQVGVRLPHHLDPLTFSVWAWRDYGLLVLVLVLVRCRLKTRHRALQWLERWMIASLLIAALGVLIAWGPRPLKELPVWELRVKLLKLYPFRMADMLIPITLACTMAAWLGEFIEDRLTAVSRFVATTTICGILLLIALSVPTLDKTLDQQPPGVQTDWLAACQWIREHAPPGAVLYAINDNWSLRWYAERPEYFHFKDCPQDAASIIEWNNRNWILYHWKMRTLTDGTASSEDLAELRKQTGITHLVCGRFGPVEIKPAFRSTNISVYELPQ